MNGEKSTMKVGEKEEYEVEKEKVQIKLETTKNGHRKSPLRKLRQKGVNFALLYFILIFRKCQVKKNYLFNKFQGEYYGCDIIWKDYRG